MAFIQRNTRNNPDDRQTMPIFDPEKILKPWGHLKKTTASISKVYQPKTT
jgi:hypothetical protein